MCVPEEDQLEGLALDESTTNLLQSPSHQLSLYDAIQARKYELPKLSDLSSYSSWIFSTRFFLRNYYNVSSSDPLVTTVDNPAQSRHQELKVHTCLINGSDAQLLFANKGDLYDGKGLLFSCWGRTKHNKRAILLL